MLFVESLLFRMVCIMGLFETIMSGVLATFVFLFAYIMWYG